jgi:hypothetical protein
VRSQAGQRAVQVLHQGQVISMPVQLGLSNDTATEVLSGLQEGDQVILNATRPGQTSQTRAPVGRP